MSRTQKQSRLFPSPSTLVPRSMYSCRNENPSRIRNAIPVRMQRARGRRPEEAKRKDNRGVIHEGRIFLGEREVEQIFPRSHTCPSVLARSRRTAASPLWHYCAGVCEIVSFSLSFSPSRLNRSWKTRMNKIGITARNETCGCV